jgi:hypothetical protein
MERPAVFGLAMLLCGPAFAELPPTWDDPAQMEKRIADHLQEYAKDIVPSVQSVKCGETQCQLRIAGVDLNADQSLFDRVYLTFVQRMQAQGIPVRTGASFRTEISPGVMGTLVTFSSAAPPPEFTRRRSSDSQFE